jgi:hypothetical protein
VQDQHPLTARGLLTSLVKKTVALPDARERARSFSTSARAAPSSSVSGSSSTSSGGSAMSTEAMANSCFCPPESCVGCDQAWPARPISASNPSTVRSISAGSRSRFSSTTPISSKTTAEEKQFSGFWVTRPAGSTGSSPLAAALARTTVPAVGSTTLARSAASLLLPAPFAPRTTIDSPGRTPRVMSRSAGRLLNFDF